MPIDLSRQRLRTIRTAGLVVGAAVALLGTTGLVLQPSLPAVGSVVHSVTEIVEVEPHDPADPYHLPTAALTPPQRRMEQWTLVGPNVLERASFAVVRDAQGATVQVAHKDTSTGVEQNWWAAWGRAWIDQAGPPSPILEWDSASLARKRQEGYRQVSTTTIGSKTAQVYERRALGTDDATYVHRFFVATEPAGVGLGERLEQVAKDGSVVTIRDVTTVLWEVLPGSVAPAELRSWAPPADAHVSDLRTRRPVVVRSTVSTIAELERVAPFRVPRAAPGAVVQSVFYTGARSSARDRGSFNDAVPSGDAAYVIYQTGTPGQAVTLVFGSRDPLVERVRRTPAFWEQASSSTTQVAGAGRPVWLMASSPSGSPGPGLADASVPAVTLTAIVDLGDILLVASFQGFDERGALEFLRQLSLPPQN